MSEFPNQTLEPVSETVNTLSEVDRAVLALIRDAPPARLSSTFLGRQLNARLPKIEASIVRIFEAGLLPEAVVTKFRPALSKKTPTAAAARAQPAVRSAVVVAAETSPEQTAVRKPKSIAAGEVDLPREQVGSQDATGLTPASEVPATETSPPALINLDEIHIDAALQVRAGTRDERIEQYAELMTDGVVFPPIDLVRIDGTLFLVDGFHRLAAARRSGNAKILAVVRDGDRRTGFLRAIEANSKHGEPLTREEKRNAAMALLRDAEWSRWTNGSIAMWCGLSKMSVGRFRRRIAEVGGCGNDYNKVTDDVRTFETATGERRQMNVSRIRRQGRRWQPGKPSQEGDNSESTDAEVLPMIHKWGEVSARVIAISADTIRRVTSANEAIAFVDLATRVHTLARDVEPDHDGTVTRGVDMMICAVDKS